MSEKNGKLVRRYVERYNEALRVKYEAEAKLHESVETKQKIARVLRQNQLSEKRTKMVFNQMSPKDKSIQRNHMVRYLAQNHGVE